MLGQSQHSMFDWMLRNELENGMDCGVKIGIWVEIKSQNWKRNGSFMSSSWSWEVGDNWAYEFFFFLIGYSLWLVKASTVCLIEDLVRCWENEPENGMACDAKICILIKKFKFQNCFNLFSVVLSFLFFSELWTWIYIISRAWKFMTRFRVTGFRNSWIQHHGRSVFAILAGYS